MIHSRFVKIAAVSVCISTSLILASCYGSNKAAHCDAYGNKSGSTTGYNYNGTNAIQGTSNTAVNTNGQVSEHRSLSTPPHPFTGQPQGQDLNLANGINSRSSERSSKSLSSKTLSDNEDSSQDGIADSDDNGIGESSIFNRSIPDVASEYERYTAFDENQWVASQDEVKSTFSIDVDKAAYTNFRRFVNEDKLPPKDAIRLEEWLNFFNYELEAPAETDEHPLKITTEVRPCPWNTKDNLVMVKLQAKQPIEANLPPSNLVFLVDVSGSMNSQNKLPLVQESMEKLLAKLRPQDKMSIVTYAGSSLVVLEPTSGSEKAKIKKAINGLTSGGGTAGADGINTAYKLAEENFLADGNNRVIVATDGDWNIGIRDDTALKNLISKKRKTGIFLSVLGFGMYNLNDAMMESLADNGNGNYAYIDSEKEATRLFDSEFAGSMYVIAKDVKLQLEFDPAVVEKYRLIGYENRVLENWQFAVDSIDAGDLGMGENVIAFYQVTSKEGAEETSRTEGIGKIDFRYKPLKSDVSKLLSVNIGNDTEEASSDFKFASCVVEFAMCLRESEFRGSANMKAAILRGKQNLGDPSHKLSYEKRVEFVGLMDDVTGMWEDYVLEEAPQNTEDNAPELKLYPNPASEFTTVEIPKSLSAEWSVQIFTMNGALKKVQHFKEVEKGRVDLSGLEPNTYLIKVYGSGYSYGYLRLVVI